MITRTICLTLVFFAFICQQVMAQPPVFSANPTNGSPNVTFTLSNLPGLSQVQAKPVAPFFWAFWIFDNGEYYPEMKRTTTSGGHRFCWHNYPYNFSGPFQNSPNWGTSQSYNYPSNTTISSYNPSVIAIERKGDDPPPTSYTIHSTNLTVSTSTSNSNATPRIISMPNQNGKYIHLAHSHGYVANHMVNGSRDGEESVFIISYKPQCISANATGKVYLYYGAKRAGGPGGNLSQSTHFAGTAATHLYPKYYSGQNNTNNSSSFTPPSFPLFSRQEGFSFTNTFMNTVQNVIGQGNEFRLFEQVTFEDPKLPSQAPDLSIYDWSFALAILTSTDTCVSADTNMFSFLSQYELRQGGKLKGTNDFIIGVDTIFLKSGEPSDPNRLQVVDFCKCDNTTYKLTLELKYTNLGTDAPGATIKLNPIAKNYQICDVIGATDQNGPIGFNWDSGSNTLTFQKPTTANPGYLLGMGKTGTVKFTVIATNVPTNNNFSNWVSNLFSNPFVSAAVTFDGTKETLVCKNESGEQVTAIVLGKKDTECTDCNCPRPKSCTWCWYLLLGVVVLAAAAYLIKNR